MPQARWVHGGLNRDCLLVPPHLGCQECLRVPLPSHPHSHTGQPPTGRGGSCCLCSHFLSRSVVEFREREMGREENHRGTGWWPRERCGYSIIRLIQHRWITEGHLIIHYLAGGKENYSLFNMSWNENATLCKTCKVTYYGNCSQSFNVSAARLINLLRASLEFLFEMIVLVTECTTESRNVRKATGGFSNQPFLRVLSATSGKDRPVTLSGPSQTHGLRRFSRSRLAHCVLCVVV